MIAPHAMMAAPDFVLQPLRAISVGAGVRHFENGRHPAQHSGAAARFEVFLMLKARLAEMHLTVDDARQNIQDRKSVEEGTRVSVRVNLGGCGILKKKKQ